MAKSIFFFTDLQDENVIKALQSARRVKVEQPEDNKKEAVNDMETCFGFDVSVT